MEMEHPKTAMRHSNVLILDTDDLRRQQIADALVQLGVPQVLQAPTAEVALAMLRNTAGIGIGICGVESGQLETFALAGHERRLDALVLVGDSGELHRQARRLSHIGRLPILGCLDLPVRSDELAELLSRYCALRRRNEAALPTKGELQEALARGEFQARFQPVFELPGLRPVGIELGVVWVSPVYGELGSRRFLPAMVAYELIDELFAVLLAQGLDCLARLPKQHNALRLTCQLQPSQLRGNHFIELLQAHLECKRISPARLVFELEESGLLNLPGHTLEQLERLRALGCELSVGQFGAAFSSIQLLCRQHFQHLKLAPQFVRELDYPCAWALASSSLALARTLNMQMVAGGVTKASQHQALMDMGCTRGLGSYYVAPMSETALRAWLHAC